MRILLTFTLMFTLVAPLAAQNELTEPSCIEIGEVAHRWIPDHPGLGDISLQIPVTNTCGQTRKMWLHVEMLDTDGFLLETTFVTLTTVQPGADTLRIKHPMSRSLADRVARYKAVVKLLEP